MCSIGRGGHQSLNQIGRLVRCLSAPLGQNAAMLIRRVERFCDCLSLCMYLCLWVPEEETRKDRKKKRGRGAADWLLHVPVAVRLGAAGLFLSLSPIRDHKAYHDGSLYIYQQNTGQKTQTRLCVQQSSPLKLRGDCDCERLWLWLWEKIVKMLFATPNVPGVL